MISFMVCNPANAKSGVSLGYGYQTYMYGYSIGIQHATCVFCKNECNQGFAWPISGYWDAQAYNFQSKNRNPVPVTNIVGGSVAYIFRFERKYITCCNVPYADLGFGLAYFNRKSISCKDMGTQLPILIKAGFGFTFGEKLEYDLGYKFVNFSGFAGKRSNSINANFIVLNFWF